MYGELRRVSDDPALDVMPAMTVPVVFHVAVGHRAVNGVPFRNQNQHRKNQSIVNDLLGGGVVVVVDAAEIASSLYLL